MQTLWAVSVRTGDAQCVRFTDSAVIFHKVTFEVLRTLTVKTAIFEGRQTVSCVCYKCSERAGLIRMAVIILLFNHRDGIFARNYLHGVVYEVLQELIRFVLILELFYSMIFWSRERWV